MSLPDLKHTLYTVDRSHSWEPKTAALPPKSSIQHSAVFQRAEPCRQHQTFPYDERDEGAMPSLECTCGSPFRDEKALREHRKAKSHYICRRCNKCLLTIRSFMQHEALLATCWQNPLKDMLWRCNDCGQVFDTRAASNRHLQETGHATEFRCCDCNRHFKTENALLDHLGAKVHPTPVKKPEKCKKFTCKDCDRTFKNSTALRQHLNSVVHRPISNLPCMAGKICDVDCSAHFRSPSAMVAHMESGTCRAGMDRQKLNSLVFLQDNENLITASSTFESLGWASLGNEEGSSICSGVMTPSTDSDDGVILTPSSSQLDMMSLARRGTVRLDSSDAESTCTELPADGVYLCPLCSGSGRRFYGAVALEQHMQSPAHAPKMFHCPSFLFQEGSGKSEPSMKRFRTISGLVAHIESGACRDGNASLRTVMQYMEERLEDMGISFKLLSI